MTPARAREILSGSMGGFITVCFIKRTNGERRVLNGRFGVFKNVTGAGLKFDPEKKNLMTIFDVHKKAYRMINLDDVVYIKMNHKHYE